MTGHLDENPEKDEQDILDAAISFDGTWAKQGFTSLTGVVFAISVDTGEILDYHVLSKSCLKCMLKKGKCSDKELKSGCLNMSVILTLLVVHQPWRVKELLSCGVDQLLIITASGISGWFVMETVKHLILLNHREEALREAERVTYEAGGF